MGGLHRGLELIAANDVHGARGAQQCLGLIDHQRIPCAGILFGERHVVAVRITPCGATRLGKQHQREQPKCFRLIGHQRDDEPAKPHPFFGKIPAARLGAGRIGPAFGESRVDRGEHRFEPLRQLAALRHAKRNAGFPDLVLRARETLPHGGRRDQEG